MSRMPGSSQLLGKAGQRGAPTSLRFLRHHLARLESLKLYTTFTRISGRTASRLAPVCFATRSATANAAERPAPWLRVADWTFPFLMPTISVISTATYMGLTASGQDWWVQAAIIAAGPLVLHGVIPLLDWALGEQPPPPLPPTDKAPGPDNLASRIVPTLSVLAHLAAAWFAYAAIATAPLQPGLLPLLTYSLATSAATAMAASHELVHSRNPVHLAAAWTFLTLHWWYPYYRAHLQHHLHVATDVDYTSAGKGRGLYTFLVQYITGSYAEAWQLATAECDRVGKPHLSFHNSTLVALAAQALTTLGIYLAFGPFATAVHMGTCAVLLVYMTMFDYFLHYGLTRPALPDKPGRYTPVTPYISWNSLYPLENALLFNVLCHSDHHMYGNKSYGWLRAPASVPTFPGPINAVGLAALVPPLWSALMDPRATEANENNLRHLGMG